MQFLQRITMPFIFLLPQETKTRSLYNNLSFHHYHHQNHISRSGNTLNSNAVINAKTVKQRTATVSSILFLSPRSPSALSYISRAPPSHSCPIARVISSPRGQDGLDRFIPSDVHQFVPDYHTKSLQENDDERRCKRKITGVGVGGLLRTCRHNVQKF